MTNEEMIEIKNRYDEGVKIQNEQNNLTEAIEILRSNKIASIRLNFSSRPNEAIIQVQYKDDENVSWQNVCWISKYPELQKEILIYVINNLGEKFRKLQEQYDKI